MGYYLDVKKNERKFTSKWMKLKKIILSEVTRPQKTNIGYFHFLFLKIYLFILYEYTVAVFRHTRRGHRIPLQMIVSHHVDAGN